MGSQESPTVGAALSLFPTSCGVSGFLNASPEVSVFIKQFSKCQDSVFSQKLMYVCRTQRWLKNSSSDFFFFLMKSRTTVLL